MGPFTGTATLTIQWHLPTEHDPATDQTSFSALISTQITERDSQGSGFSIAIEGIHVGDVIQTASGWMTVTAIERDIIGTITLYLSPQVAELAPDADLDANIAAIVSGKRQMILEGAAALKIAIVAHENIIVLYATAPLFEVVAPDFLQYAADNTAEGIRVAGENSVIIRNASKIIDECANVIRFITGIIANVTATELDMAKLGQAEQDSEQYTIIRSDAQEAATDLSKVGQDAQQDADVFNWMEYDGGKVPVTGMTGINDPDMLSADTEFARKMDWWRQNKMGKTPVANRVTAY